jgi:hypothetical protein
MSSRWADSTTTHSRSFDLFLGVLLVWVGAVALGGLLAPAAGAVTLPDHRVYELVTRYEKEGHEHDLNGVQAGYGYTSRDGNAIEWQAIGGCCGATSAAQITYESYRTPSGWQAKSVMPEPTGSEGGGLLTLFLGGEVAQDEFWTPDMQRMIFAVPKAHEPGVEHLNDQRDLYLREPNDEFTLESKGPLWTGEEEEGATFDGATPDANYIVFSSSEPLTLDAVGLQPRNPDQQYLYLRDVATGTTTLIDVDNSGALLGVEGASLGNAGNVNGVLQPANTYGSNTNAISTDGSKVFFQAPPFSEGRTPVETTTPQLYMRDLANSTTTALDAPNPKGWAAFEGATEDGSLVYFTSNEGLDGAPAVPELYAYNTTGAAIGAVPSMSSVPISLGNAGVAPNPPGPVVGISAIANDGSRVWFVADDVLAANHNAAGAEAVAGQPNLYMYDERSGATTYVATVGLGDINTCEPNCGEGSRTGLVGEPDLARRAFPTPDGSALVFESASDLTGEDDIVQTKLTAPVAAGEHTIQVESTADMNAKQAIMIGTGAAAEREEIQSVDSPTEITVTEFDERSDYGIVGEFAAGEPVERPDVEDYRFLATGSLICFSCAGAGVVPDGMGTLGITGGGTYGPAGQNVPMNEDASQIFFESANALLPEAEPARPGHEVESWNVYEWENGHLYLISDGTQSGSILDGTTPSGEDVFFSTRSQLTPNENGDWINVYDARVNGGFPEPPPETAPCIGAACRAPSPPSPSFEVPGSSAGVGEEEAGKAAGSFTVAPLTAAQREGLARTGRVKLKVTTTVPGTLTATLRARVKGKSEQVARATAKVAKAGSTELDLRLSGSARDQLAARRSLALRLHVGFSASDKAATVRLTLHASSAKGKVKHG